MKASAGLLSVVVFFALPAVAQRMTASTGNHSSSGNHSSGGNHSSAGSHASAGSSSRGSSPAGSGGHMSSSAGSAASYTGPSVRASGRFVSSSSGGSSGSVGGGAGNGSGGRSAYFPSVTAGFRTAGPGEVVQAAGRYVGSRLAPSPASLALHGVAPAPFVSRPPSGAMVAAAATAVAGRHAPYITAQAVISQDRNSGTGGSWSCTPSVDCDFFGGNAHFFHSGFHCFGSFFENPYSALYYRGYGSGLNSGMPYPGYRAEEPSREPPSDEPPSAPGTYVSDALTPAQPEGVRAPRSITLLALKDGTMYGVSEYWLDQGVLHYIPSYGGENSLPLERVDINKTVELNSAKGIGFVLRNSPAVRPPVTPVPFP